MDILDRLCMFIGEARAYKPRKVHHGRKRSQASKMKGAEKARYKKNLLVKKRRYKNSAVMKNKAKKTAKKYKKTAKAQRVKRMYKGKR